MNFYIILYKTYNTNTGTGNTVLIICIDVLLYLLFYFIFKTNFINLELWCRKSIETGNTLDIFKDVIMNYTGSQINRKWKSKYAPYCMNTECAEYIDPPEYFNCETVPPSKQYRRLCYCDTEGSYALHKTTVLLLLLLSCC